MLSVAIATHNEEKMLARCLEKIKNIADEIVITDGESTDNTVKIAKQFDAKIISTTNKLNFHINKQIAIDACKGDLILQLDADELVDKELLAFIKKTHDNILKNNHDTSEAVAWWIRRKNYFLGRFLKKGGQYPDPVIRLFLKGKAYLPQKDVHEQLEVKGEVGWAEGHLLHYSNPSFADYVRKFNTYTTFKADQLKTAKVEITIINTFVYIIIKPLQTFFSLFLRHKGFIDGFPGFVFSVMSGVHHVVAYLKLWEIKETQKK